MKIYLDMIFLLNSIFDFLLLMSVSILLRRKASYKRILLGSLIGGISIFVLFIKINSIELFLIKIIISILMVIITFSYKNMKYTMKNLFFLYTSSIILGGFLYYLNIEFSYKQEGLVFFHNGLSINFVVLIIFSPIILYTYIRQGISLKNNYNNYYKVNLYYQNKKYQFTAYLDTGNKLIDPYFHKPIIIINENILSFDDYMLIPVNTINSKSMIKCIKVNKLEIEKVGIKKDVLVGISNIKMDGIDMLLNQKIMED